MRNSQNLSHEAPCDDNPPPRLTWLVWPHRTPGRCGDPAETGRKLEAALQANMHCHLLNHAHWALTLILWARGGPWLWPSVREIVQSPETTFPTSAAKTTSRVLPCRPESSGYQSSFLRRAASRTAPSTSAQRGRGAPSRHNAETSVVSTATCAPWNKGKPSARTSMRRSSSWFGTNPHVSGDPPTRFTAHARCCRLHSEPTTPNNPRHGACCSVVATEIEWMATPANTAGRGKKKSQAAKEKDAKHLCVKRGKPRDWATRERNTGEWSALGAATWSGNCLVISATPCLR